MTMTKSNRNARRDYIVYGRTNPQCKYCDAAKALLELHELNYTFEDTSNVDVYTFVQRMGWKTVPQIELWDENDRIIYIGGYEDLKKYIKENEDDGE